MRKLVLSVVVATAAIAAVPASAQSWRLSHSVHRQIQGDINQLENRIDRSERRGVISRREANGLQRQANQTKRAYWQYSRNGLTRWEVADLELRVNRLHQRLRFERRDWDGRRG